MNEQESTVDELVTADEFLDKLIYDADVHGIEHVNGHDISDIYVRTEHFLINSVIVTITLTFDAEKEEIEGIFGTE